MLIDITYFATAASIIFFIASSVYIWIKTFKDFFSKLSLIWFFLSFLALSILFFLLHKGVISLDTTVPNFISILLKSSLSKFLSKLQLDFISISFIMWVSLLFLFSIKDKVIKKITFLSFLNKDEYINKVNCFLYVHKSYLVTSLSIIYALLLYLSVTSYFTVGGGNYWFLFLFYWSSFVLFAACIQYISITFKSIN